IEAVLGTLLFSTRTYVQLTTIPFCRYSILSISCSVPPSDGNSGTMETGRTGGAQHRISFRCPFVINPHICQNHVRFIIPALNSAHSMQFPAPHRRTGISDVWAIGIV